MKRFWNWDAGLGLVLTLAAVVSATLAVPFTESLENKLYDLRVRSAKIPPPSDDIRLVAIDAPSLEAIGRWPWPRSVVAELIRRIAAGEPRALGCAIIFSEPDENHGLNVLRELKDEYTTILKTEEGAVRPLLLRLSKDPRYKNAVRDHPFGDLRGFGQTLDEAAEDLDNDAKLTEALAKAKGVLLSFYFRSLGRTGGEETPETIDRLKNMGLLQSQVEESEQARLPEGGMPLLPLAGFSKRVEGLGHATVIQDLDGSVRRDAPIMMGRGQYVPSLALQMARVGMGLKPKDIRVRPGRDIQLGQRTIPLDRDSMMLIKFADGMDNIKKDSAVDVLRDNGGIPSKTFKNKLVLVGITDTAMGSSFVTPVDSAYQFNGLVLSSLRNIWEGNFLSRPLWAPRAEYGWLGLIGLFVTFLLPRLKAKQALAVTLGLAVVTVGAGWYLFLAKNWWIKLFYPLAVLGSAYVIVTVRRFYFT